MESVFVDEDGTATGDYGIQATVALDGDGIDIVQPATWLRAFSPECRPSTFPRPPARHGARATGGQRAGHQRP